MGEYLSGKSDMSRSMLVAGLMLLALLGSLALAHLLSTSRDPESALERVQHGALSYRVPKNWKSIGRNSVTQGAHILAEYNDPTRDRDFVVAQLRSNAPRSILVALHLTLQDFLGENHFKVTARLTRGRTQSFRQGMLVGMRYSDPLERFWCGVATIDGRRYWVAMLRATDPSDSPTNGQLHDRMCRSFTSRNWQRASTEQLRQVGLDESMPALDEHRRVVGLVRPDHQSGDPVMLVPLDGPPTVESLRLLIQIDLSDRSETGLPTPGQMIERAFVNATQRQPGPGDIFVRQIAKRPAWGAILRRDLSRQLWYVRLTKHRAALVEVMATNGRMKQATQWVEALVATTNEDTADHDDQAAAALSRGTELASQLRRTFDTSTRQPFWVYRVIEEDGDAIGCTIERNDVRQSDGLPVRGWSKHVMFTALSERAFQWQCAADASVVRIEERHLVASRGKLDLVRTFDLHHQQLTVTQKRADGSSQPIVTHIKPSYVPPIAIDVWPLEMLEQWRPQGAILWISEGLTAPEPCWVDLIYRDQRPVVRMRSLMSLDGIESVLGNDGRALRVTVCSDTNHALGSKCMTLRNIDRQSAMELSPAIREFLSKLDEE